MVKSILWGLAATGVLAAAPLSAAELKVAVVNFNQLLQESPQTKAVAEALRAEFLPRQRELQNAGQLLKTREDKFQKNAATMSDEQRAREERELRESERDLQRKQSEAQDDLNARRNEELSRLQRTIIEQVKTYAKGQGYDLVLADGVIYANSTIDITPQLLQVLHHTTGGASGNGSGSSGAAHKSSKSPKSSGPP